MKKHNNNNLFKYSLDMEAAPNSGPSSTTTTSSASGSGSAAAPAGVLGMKRASRPISKPRPKIRIIHIFAPEIIKTDAANFRELVQRLTGKPKTAGKMTSPPPPPPPPAVKEECGYEFLGGFQDLDGYFNMCELPFYPLESHYMTMHNNVIVDHEPHLIA